MTDKKFWITLGIILAVIVVLVVLFVVFIHNAGIWAGIVCILSFITGGALGWLLSKKVSITKKKQMLND